MKKTGIIIMAAVLAAGVVNAVDFGATADFASAYVWRGATVNNGLVFQPGASISGLPIPAEYGALTFGTWANYDIEENANGNHEFSEVDYYATYALPIKVVDLSATYTAYTYPHSGDDVETDQEIALTVGKAIGETGLYPSLTVNYGLDGGVEKDWYIQGGLGYTKNLTEALSLSSSVKVAYLIDDDGPDGFNDATASIGLAYKLTENWSIKGSLNYVAQLDDDVLTDDEYDKPFYGMLGVACNF